MVIELIAIVFSGLSLLISLLAYYNARKIQKRSDLTEKATYYYQVYAFKPEFSFHPNRITFIGNLRNQELIQKWKDAMYGLGPYVDSDMRMEYQELIDIISNPSNYNQDIIQVEFDVKSILFVGKCKRKYEHYMKKRDKLA